MKLHQTNHQITLANFLRKNVDGSGNFPPVEGPYLSLAHVLNPILFNVYGLLTYMSGLVDDQT